MRTLLIVLALGLALIACKSTNSPAYSEQELEEFENFVSNQKMEFVAEWAMPLTTNALNQISNANLLPPGSNAARINLIGNSNFLRFHGDSVSAQLPYYGERQLGGSYGSHNTGIILNGKAKNLNVVKDEKKQSYQYTFTIDDDSNENYRVNLTVFPNRNTIVRINSSERFTIGYQGKVDVLDDELLK